MSNTQGATQRKSEHVRNNTGSHEQASQQIQKLSITRYRQSDQYSTKREKSSSKREVLQNKIQLKFDEDAKMVPGSSIDKAERNIGKKTSVLMKWYKSRRDTQNNLEYLENKIKKPYLKTSGLVTPSTNMKASQGVNNSKHSGIISSPFKLKIEQERKSPYIRLTQCERQKLDLKMETNKQTFLQRKEQESLRKTQQRFRHTNIMEQVQADIQRNQENKSKIVSLKSATRNKTIEYDKVNKSVNEYK